MEQKLGWSRVANAPDGNTKEAKTTRAVSPKPAGGKGARKKSAAKKTTTKQRVGKKPARKGRTVSDVPVVPKTEPKKSGGPAVAAQVPRMKQVYLHDVVEVLAREFGYNNPMQVPSIEKIVLNIGLGEALKSNSAVASAKGDLEKITGQKPIENRSKVSIANFKLREGSVIGSSVTLRGSRMWQFLDPVSYTHLRAHETDS